MRSMSSRLRSSTEIRSRLMQRSQSSGGSGSCELLRDCAGERADRDLVDLVELEHADVDALGRRGRQVLADVVGADRKLAVAAVGQDRELDPARAAVVEER